MSQKLQYVDTYSGLMLSILSLSICVFFVPVFMCGCGHLPAIALFLTLPNWLMAIAGFVLNKGLGYVTRGFVACVFVLTSLIFIKNLHNVLLSGHNPLFPHY